MLLDNFIFLFFSNLHRIKKRSISPGCKIAKITMLASLKPTTPTTPTTLLEHQKVNEGVNKTFFILFVNIINEKSNDTK